VRQMMPWPATSAYGACLASAGERKAEARSSACHLQPAFVGKEKEEGPDSA
jgi:hypothetical protein